MSIDQSAIVFRRKISSFCEMKLAPLTNAKQFRALSAFTIGLIDNRMPPPMLGRHVNWEEISLACGFEQTSVEFRRVAQYGFDAISRWLTEPGSRRRTPLATGKSTKTRSRAISLSSRRTLTTAKASHRLKPGPKPKRIEEFPEPLFETYEEPVSFQAALQFHIDRFGESYYHLHRAIFRDGDGLEATTLLNWLKGHKVPRSVANLENLNRIERRYRLPLGYFKEKLPHQSRAAMGSEQEQSEIVR